MGLLDGKIAIITGAGTGIGRSAALMFAEQGASLVLAGRRIEPLDEVVALVEANGGTAVAKSVDLENGDAAADLGSKGLVRFCASATSPVATLSPAATDAALRSAGRSPPSPPSAHPRPLERSGLSSRHQRMRATHHQHSYCRRRQTGRRHGALLTQRLRPTRAAQTRSGTHTRFPSCACCRAPSGSSSSTGRGDASAVEDCLLTRHRA